MEFTWLLPAVIIYMVVRSIAKGAKVASEEARRRAGDGSADGAVAAGTSVGAGDLMRELQKVLEESRRMAESGSPTASRPAPRPTARRKPVTVSPAPRQVAVRVKGEEARSLEVISEEGTSLDAEAEVIIARRRAEVRRRNRELAGEHHAQFDKRIRAEPVRSTPVPAPGLHPAGGLRQAIIWKEVLGKPVGLR
jgi:hypothetical protein